MMVAMTAKIVEPAASLGGFVVGRQVLVEAEVSYAWRRRDATWNRCYGNETFAVEPDGEAAANGSANPDGCEDEGSMFRS